MKQNLREAKINQERDPWDPSKVVKRISHEVTAKDSYDFWKTGNDEESEAPNLDYNSDSKLTALVGKNNKLWLEKVNQDLNFDAVSQNNRASHDQRLSINNSASTKAIGANGSPTYYLNNNKSNSNTMLRKQ